MRMAEPAKATGGEALPDWDAAANEAIAACGGNAHAAVRALLILNDALDRELTLARAAMPTGFARGWFQRKAAGE